MNEVIFSFMSCLSLFHIGGIHDCTDSSSYTTVTTGLVFLRFTLKPLLHPKSAQLSPAFKFKGLPFLLQALEHCIDCTSMGQYLIGIHKNLTIIHVYEVILILNDLPRPTKIEGSCVKWQGVLRTSQRSPQLRCNCVLQQGPLFASKLHQQLVGLLLQLCTCPSRENKRNLLFRFVEFFSLFHCFPMFFRI